MNAVTLGGRLPLLNPGELTGAQRAVYDRLLGTFVKWADQSGFQSMAEGGRLIGPFNPVLFSPLISQALLDLQQAEQANTSLGERVRQAVLLSVGAVWRSDYELYAHVDARAIAAGALPDGLGQDERLAASFARQLAAEHRVEPALYAAAEKLFGAAGLVDITLLAGIYHVVCGLLNAFEVPAPTQKLSG